MPEDFTVIFPPLSTPTAVELSGIAKATMDTTIAAFQAGLIDKAAAMKELKKQADNTGLFDSISDEDIAAGAGVTWQDVTALKDPLAGIPEVDAGPFERGLSLDYNPYHGPNGRFTSGGGGGKIKGTKYAPSPQRSREGIQLKPKTYARLCGVLGTRYPGLEAGEIRTIRDSKWEYVVRADGYGGMVTLHRKRI